MTYLYIHQTSGYLSTANTSYLLCISLLIFHMLLQNLHLNWLVDAKNIDFLYSIITYYIWTIQLAMNFFSFMPAIDTYLNRKTINRTNKRKLIRLWVVIKQSFSRIHLLCPKTINRSKLIKGEEYWSVAVICLADRCLSISYVSWLVSH